MGNKKVQEYLLTLGLVAGLTAGTVAGGKMLVDMDQLSTARAKNDTITSGVISTETFRDMRASAENAVDLVYDLGLIDAEEQGKMSKEIKTSNFAYINRDKLVDVQTANEWENAVTSENREMGEMCLSAMTAGGAFAIAGFIAVNMAYKKGKQEEALALKKPVVSEEPTL